MTDSCTKNIRKFENNLASSKYVGWIYQYWVKSLPSDLRLSKSLRNVRLPLGLFVQFSALAMFLFFFISGIETSKKASFLSLDKTAGDCSDVKITISDTFTVDYDGYWSTSVNYMENKAIFDVQFVNVEMNQNEYNYFVQEMLYPYFKNLNMSEKTWAENYLILTKSDKIQFDYGGGIIFVRFLIAPFTYQNVYYKQFCDISKETCTQSKAGGETINSFDTIAYSSLLKSYSINSANYFTKDDRFKECDINQNSNYEQSEFTTGLDIYKLENSAGINDYVIEPWTKLSYYERVYVPWAFSYLVNGNTSTQYCNNLQLNPKITTLNFPIIGTGIFSSTYNPSTGEYGNNYAYSDECNSCLTATKNSICTNLNVLSLYVGNLQISYPDGLTNSSNIVECRDYDYSTGIYHDCAFQKFYTQEAINNRTILSSELFGLIDIYNSYYNITQLKNDPNITKYLNFDAIQNIRITQFMASDIIFNQAGGLSGSNVQLSCIDSLGEFGPFRPDAETYTTAPTKLTENYYVCTPSSTSAFFDSFGIASSNTVTFMGIFLTIMITGYVTCVKYTSSKEITAVSGDDVESQIEMLGVALVNRTVTRTKKQSLPSGVISSISDELVKEEEEIESGQDVELSSVKNPYLNQNK
jgi:hypothetical protein